MIKQASRHAAEKKKNNPDNPDDIDMADFSLEAKQRKAAISEALQYVRSHQRNIKAKQLCKMVPDLPLAQAKGLIVEALKDYEPDYEGRRET